MATKKTEAPAQSNEGAPTRKELNDLKAYVRRLHKRLEQLIGFDIDGDGKVGASKLPALAGIFVLASVMFVWAAENEVVRYIAQEGNDAVITLEADEGDDAADELQIIMTAGGSGSIEIGGTEVLNLPASQAGETVTAATSTVTAVTTLGPINVTTLTIEDMVFEIDGSSGDGWGGTNLATVGQGYIHIVGFKVDDLALTTNSADLADGEGGDFGFGTTKTADATLTGTDVNLLAKTSLDPIQTAVDAVSVADKVPTDGTAAGTAIYLNIIADDGDVAALSTNLVNGTVTFWWLYMGDN